MQIRVSQKGWMIVTGVILLFTTLVVGRTLLHAIRIKREIRALEREKTHYTEKIEQDSTLVEQLQYDDYLEEYARERFRMQRRDEQVYIVEEDD